MERYLNRELTEDESDWFEAYLLDRPVLRSALTIDDFFQKSAPEEFKAHSKRYFFGGAAIAFAVVLSMLVWIAYEKNEVTQPFEVFVDVNRSNTADFIKLPSDVDSVHVSLLVPSNSASVWIEIAGGRRTSLKIGSDYSANFLTSAEALRSGPVLVGFVDSKDDETHLTLHMN